MTTPDLLLTGCARSLKLEPTILLDSRYENKRRKVHNRRGVMGLDLTFREGIM